ncbi:ABC transporter ATP-binding protein [Brachybacterium muris]|uniref:ABC transporter ATP-binding protein n=1 Tax=Brachybacterium muris TaxID=219301 RepID=UPI00223C32D1|nr:ATP-binding cassette domain-containing protein [Brachybacterium muris]MCT1653236.1 ATP-binding cassette domain-containing protein [Brachybacterium muris]MCT2294571.1 ATP-binding cassette domain-containing protein [Brachybacterium muris]
MAHVAFRQASRIFDPARPPAVNRVNLEIADGEFLVLVGPSGSGKSTAMRMLAGLEPVDEGSILIDGQDVTEMRARDRDVAMVFQSYALYPNMTARQNIAFALENLKLPKGEIARKVQDAARMLELEPLLDKKPAAMSGGQRQRVAMGRSIVRDPKVWCMDEPLSNLDAKLRVATRAQIASLQRELGVTTVYVTHDQTEAMTMGDRVAVLKDGVLQQVDEPTHMYEHPGNTFVAEFIGSPSITILEGVTVKDGRALLGEGHRLDLGMPAGFAQKVTDRVLVGVRPEHWEIVSRTDEDRDDQCVPLEVQLVENLGAEAFAYCVAQMTPDSTVSIRQKRIAVRLESAKDAAPGDVLWVRPRSGAGVFFDPETEINLEYL